MCQEERSSFSTMPMPDTTVCGLWCENMLLSTLLDNTLNKLCQCATSWKSTNKLCSTLSKDISNSLRTRNYPMPFSCWFWVRTFKILYYINIKVHCKPWFFEHPSIPCPSILSCKLMDFLKTCTTCAYSVISYKTCGMYQNIPAFKSNII